MKKEKKIGNEFISSPLFQYSPIATANRFITFLSPNFYHFFFFFLFNLVSDKKKKKKKLDILAVATC